MSKKGKFVKSKTDPAGQLRAIRYNYAQKTNNAKYLTKNEFRLYNNPNHLSKEKRSHPAYINLRRGQFVRFNVITHSKSFFDEPTMELFANPNRRSKDPRPSRISAPRWGHIGIFSSFRLPKQFWRISNDDLARVRKWNKKKEKSSDA